MSEPSLEDRVRAFAETVRAAAAAFRAHGAGGQHVPFHGDFASLTPSVLNRLEWWAKYMTEWIKNA